MTIKYVTFVVEEGVFGIPIKHVNYIELPSTLTKIPQSSNYIKGISTIRGDVIPIFDMKLYLFHKETSQNTYGNGLTRIIGLKVNDHEIGIIVDEAKEIVDISEDDLQQVSNPSNSEDSYTVAKRDGQLIILMSPEELLNASNILDVMNKIHHRELA